MTKLAKAKKLTEAKLNTVVLQKAMRIVLWVFIAFLLLRGVGTVIRTNDISKAESMMQEFLKSRGYKEKVEREAASFAESFAVEYMTYSKKSPDEYYARISKYLPSHIAELGMVLSTKTDVQAMEARCIGLRWTGERQLNIDVRVKATYKQEAAPSDTTDAVTQPAETLTRQRDLYIRIPIVETEGAYLVEDYPVFLPEPVKPKLKASQYSGETADSSTAQDISNMLSSFFKTYYEGKAGETQYYMADAGAGVLGLDGSFKFEKLDEARVFKNATEGSFTAIAELTVSDPYSGQKLKQRYNISLIRKDGRYYIKTFDARTLNINNTQEVVQ